MGPMRRALAVGLFALTLSSVSAQAQPLTPRGQMGAEPTSVEAIQPATPRFRARKIVGSPTAGTTGNMSGFQIPGGDQILWTCPEGAEARRLAAQRRGRPLRESLE